MKRLVLLVAMLFGLSASTIYAAGIGDTIQEVRKQYGSKVSIDESLYIFGSPPRVGRIDVDSRKFFGGALVDVSLFSKGIKPLLPADAKLTGSYVAQSGQKEIYAFRSVQLSKQPGIKDISLDSPLGSFTVYINYDGTRVVNCAICVGHPGDADLSGAKKTNKNPFK